MSLQKLARIGPHDLAQKSPFERLQLLVSALRPKRGASDEQIQAQFDSLLNLLQREPALAGSMREALSKLLQSTRQTSLYVEAGALPERSFSHELTRRISHSVLPDLSNHEDLEGVVVDLFSRRDADWVERLSHGAWLQLAELISKAPCPNAPTSNAAARLPHAIEELLDSVQLLSLRIAARGLDEEMAKLDPSLLENESAFTAQQIDVLRWLKQYRTCWLAQTAQADTAEDKAASHSLEALQAEFKHLSVLWSQCGSLVDKLHRRASRLGTSMHLSQTLASLQQMLDRIERLGGLALHELEVRASGQSFAPREEHIELLKTVVLGEVGRNSLRDLLRNTGSTLALRVTDNAARSGEHYITESRSDYWALFRSAFGSGLIIAIMTLFKIYIMAAHLPPLTEAWLICLNYGLGFVFIHIIGGTVATKQPAVTAAAIASTLGASKEKMGSTAQLIARTSRSQIASVLGNVGLAIPSGAAIAVLIAYFFGAPPTDFAGSEALLTSSHPWLSGSLIFAAVAGVCLFLSGVVAGYYDNLGAYNRIPDRIRQWGRKHPIIPATWVEKQAIYIDNNLGALMGNMIFGFMLGGVSSFGHMTGLPLDIRHVAFSSAQVGYALAGSDFGLPLSLVLWSLLGVALIGMTNLLVSFSLALWLAFRARRLPGRLYPKLLESVLQLFKAQPKTFLLPPESPKPAAAESAEGNTAESKNAP